MSAPIYKLAKTAPDVSAVMQAGGFLKQKAPKTLAPLQGRPSSADRDDQPMPMGIGGGFQSLGGGGGFQSLGGGGSFAANSPPAVADEEPSLAEQIAGGAKPKIPSTRIPSKYHKVATYPVLPDGIPRDQKDGLEYKATFERMLADVFGTDGSGSNPGSGGLARRDISQVQREQEVYDIVLHEIIRQIYGTCVDRAVLLENVTKRYRSLFSNVPVILADMQQEIDALADTNKSLRVLLERLMEEKTMTEQQLAEKLVENSRLSKSLSASEAEVVKLKEHLGSVIDERDALASKCKQEQQQHYLIERQNREMTDKAQQAKADLKSLTQQLALFSETAMNKIYEFEAKEIGAKSKEAKQGQGEQKPAEEPQIVKLSRVSGSLMGQCPKCQPTTPAAPASPASHAAPSAQAAPQASAPASPGAAAPAPPPAAAGQTGPPEGVAERPPRTPSPPPYSDGPGTTPVRAHQHQQQQQQQQRGQGEGKEEGVYTCWKCSRTWPKSQWSSAQQFGSHHTRKCTGKGTRPLQPPRDAGGEDDDDGGREEDDEGNEGEQQRQETSDEEYSQETSSGGDESDESDGDGEEASGGSRRRAYAARSRHKYCGAREDGTYFCRRCGQTWPAGSYKSVQSFAASHRFACPCSAAAAARAAEEEEEQQDGARTPGKKYPTLSIVGADGSYTCRKCGHTWASGAWKSVNGFSQGHVRYCKGRLLLEPQQAAAAAASAPRSSGHPKAHAKSRYHCPKCLRNWYSDDWAGYAQFGAHVAHCKGPNTPLSRGTPACIEEARGGTAPDTSAGPFRCPRCAKTWPAGTWKNNKAFGASHVKSCHANAHAPASAPGAPKPSVSSATPSRAPAAAAAPMSEPPARKRYIEIDSTSEEERRPRKAQRLDEASDADSQLAPVASASSAPGTPSCAARAAPSAPARLQQHAAAQQHPATQQHPAQAQRHFMCPRCNGRWDSNLFNGGEKVFELVHVSWCSGVFTCPTLSGIPPPQHEQPGAAPQEEQLVSGEVLSGRMGEREVEALVDGGDVEPPSWVAASSLDRRTLLALVRHYESSRPKSNLQKVIKARIKNDMVELLVQWAGKEEPDFMEEKEVGCSSEEDLGTADPVSFFEETDLSTQKRKIRVREEHLKYDADAARDDGSDDGAHDEVPTTFPRSSDFQQMVSSVFSVHRLLGQQQVLFRQRLSAAMDLVPRDTDTLAPSPDDLCGGGDVLSALAASDDVAATSLAARADAEARAAAADAERAALARERQELREMRDEAESSRRRAREELDRAAEATLQRERELREAEATRASLEREMSTRASMLSASGLGAEQYGSQRRTLQRERDDFEREVAYRQRKFEATLDQIRTEMRRLQAMREEAAKKETEVHAAVQTQKQGLEELRRTAEELNVARGRWENSRRDKLKLELRAAEREVKTLRGFCDGQQQDTITKQREEIRQLRARVRLLEWEKDCNINEIEH
eukprot:m51a1_g2618 hypothetical protein (1458) ;mRNA; f:524844-530888